MLLYLFITYTRNCCKNLAFFCFGTTNCYLLLYYSDKFVNNITRRKF